MFIVAKVASMACARINKKKKDRPVACGNLEEGNWQQQEIIVAITLFNKMQQKTRLACEGLVSVH